MCFFFYYHIWYPFMSSIKKILCNSITELTGLISLAGWGMEACVIGVRVILERERGSEKNSMHLHLIGEEVENWCNKWINIITITKKLKFWAVWYPCLGMRKSPGILSVIPGRATRLFFNGWVHILAKRKWRPQSLMSNRKYVKWESRRVRLFLGCLGSVWMETYAFFPSL